ncbi:MAG: DNA-binding response regulator [Spirochaetes bacterium GWD1_27_9]|nr:MAG: DNA-binding response regulator [Spirochaetes bacterium GWB1_27_13]OHD25902.1 MAG: DNA-binding response regulator [Spirochaetes bacterium GWC1_27_15]OHD32536.1 MAG: DNA-binding response regulator [Spirochaetes bacterium GWD1_27_9]
MKILVVDDEIKIAEFIKLGLKEEGYVVDIAGDGEEGYFLAKKNIYDLIVLDLNLPKMDGIAVCKTLRSEKIFTPILMLTVRNKVSDKVKGLDSGANDYLTKPFSFEEFLARVRVLLRKNDNFKNTVLIVDNLELDLLSHKVKRGDVEINLTTKEFSLLEYLMQNAGSVVTRVMIIEKVWEYDFDSFTNALDVYINHLRKKIDQGFEKKLIHTVRGRGYTIKG